ncbi:type IV toxin-antitoxin system AbiEi family antitoxin domain-containing protein [Microlunatus parietis]|uniref:Very-short-patch-repair endonuclease n=1 Tax=Microlunatus parietis TaxID=682979 RepID=A0A7Y9I9I8_9ACTN|nr:type IV toxin-antitoxin system AbiEi family antitoxin domain-containing protein [Microlunatus parietis]NYE72836.1 very-short-patch-repair endonuclease [Microlunatus parietis]
MNPRIDPSAELLDLADAQAGVVTVEQAARTGLGRHSVARLVTAGQWRRLGTGLLFVHRDQPPWLAQAWAGVLSGGPESRVGGEAAAFLHGLTDAEPGQILIMVPHRRRVADRWPLIFQRERVGVRSDRSPGTPPRLTVEDTVLDLCTDSRSAVHWVTAAVQRRRTTPARLATALRHRSRQSERALLADLVAETRAGVESPLEHRYLHRVARPHALPQGIRQARRHQRAGRHDIGYPEFGVLVELDGLRGHAGEDRFRDFRRDNGALADGLVTLRYGWSDVAERPCDVAAQVATVLAQRGWPGSILRCRDCPTLATGAIQAG